MQIILKRLAKKVEFQFYEKNRKILREGHRSECMYFIVNGEILVSKKLYSKTDDQILDHPVNIISAGDCFGHVALIYEHPRNSTCRTQSRPLNYEYECVFKVKSRLSQFA